MFSIFKRKYPAIAADFSGIGTDMHSHLLPGIDDGAGDLGVTEMLKNGLEDMGYRQFITTPHIMWDIYKNTANSIGNAVKELQHGGKHTNIRAAAEYFMDDHFLEMINAGEILLTITGKRVLVEFSFVAPPMDLKDQLFKLQINGYEPIIAHPERYTYFSGNKSVFNEFKSMGCLFQMNMLSVTGYYGRIPQEIAAWLLAGNYVDFVGTDLHHNRHLDALRSSKHLRHVVSQLLESGRLLNPSLVL